MTFELRNLKEHEVHNPLFYGLDGGCVYSDAYGKILMFNKAAEQMFGWAESEVKGQNVEVLMPVELRQMHHKGMQRVRETGKVALDNRAFKLCGLRKDGTEFDVVVKLLAFRVDEDTFFTAIFRKEDDYKINEL